MARRELARPRHRRFEEARAKVLLRGRMVIMQEGVAQMMAEAEAADPAQVQEEDPTEANVLLTTPIFSAWSSRLAVRCIQLCTEDFEYLRPKTSAAVQGM